MSFEPSPRGADLRQRVTEFLDTVVVPAEPIYEEQMAAAGDPHAHPQVIEDLKTQARERGLWNLFMPHVTPGTPDPVPNLDYAYLAELAGSSHLASEAMNCSAPDTGNMETLHLFATEEQRKQWDKEHPDAKEGTGPYAYRTTVTLRRTGIAGPQTVLVKFVDGSTETALWDDTRRWARFSWVKPVKAVSAEIDPQHQHYLDADKLDDSRTVKADRSASNRWTAEVAALIELLLATVATI